MPVALGFGPFQVLKSRDFRYNITIIMDKQKIRNFSIIAHIDHGKSTLADRILEFTGAISSRELKAQILDSMELERERGITIKASAVRIDYRAEDGEEYVFNLIDTPGHVDFSYEVSRSLTACEGVLLIIDAAQGVEAQTLANTYLALEHDLEIIPVINKIDLPNADIPKVTHQLEHILGVLPEEILLCSAKDGTGIKDLVENIITRIPPPPGDTDNQLQALVFDSVYDTYRGVIVYFRVMQGEIKKGMIVRMMGRQSDYEVRDLGVFTPGRMNSTDALGPGEVGYFVGNIKTIRDVVMGDTITVAGNPCTKPLAGYKEIHPMVFCGLYPTESSEYELLQEALDKLKLNDASFHYEPENSPALGFGYRCGFLGLLHMEIVQERLEREFNLDLVTTAPNVIYEVKTTKGKTLYVENPSNLPPTTEILTIAEPRIRLTVITPAQFVGAVMKLGMDRRGDYKGIEYLDETQAMLTFEMPLNEIVLDFYDRLKSVSRGYASMDYEHIGYREDKMIKVDILINGERIDALSFICHQESAASRGRNLGARLRKTINRQLFQIAIQAAIGGKIIARESISALRKDVTAKCYGGDITRKRKLLEKQKKGKKHMKQVGNVRIPQEAFMAVLKTD